MKEKGCYAKYGPLGMFWKKVNDKGLTNHRHAMTAIKMLPKGQLWRHNQAGDLPGKGNRINVVRLNQLVESNKGKRGFTYTHKPLTKTNLEAIRQANEKGFTVNVSCETDKQADKARALGLPTVIVLEKEHVGNYTTKGGNRVVVCPATKEGATITCATCAICQKANRKAVIGFPAHGSASRFVSNLVKGESA